MKIKLFILSLILIFTASTLTGCSFGVGGGGTSVKIEPVELTIWGLFDSSDAFNKMITAYRATRPHVKIHYYKIRWEDYEQKLIESWASDTGPDIFMIHNTWMDGYTDKIYPLSDKLTLPVISSTGVLKKEEKIIDKEFGALRPQELRNIFPDVVYSDVVRSNEEKINQIYGLPLSIDTLGLFYNRTHFNAAGILTPPRTWEELTEVVKKLTLTDASGEFIRSGIALGGADNINRSNDILSLLMLQNGTTMTDTLNRISFNQASIHDSQFYPGEQALRFYTDFALPSKEVYSWNKDLTEATELFAAGKLSMMFGFPYQISTLQTQAPKIDFGIAPTLHINEDGTDALGLPVNLASYWLYTPFKRTEHPDEAWNFILSITTQQYKTEEGAPRFYAQDYLDATGRPPALKSLINEFKQNYPEFSPFADQLLTAQNWYHGANANNMNTIFKQMINNVILGKTDIKSAINFAASAISHSY